MQFYELLKKVKRGKKIEPIASCCMGSCNTTFKQITTNQQMSPNMSNGGVFAQTLIKKQNKLPLMHWFGFCNKSKQINIVYIGTIATHECGLSFNRKITTTNVF
jgi:hypothetical protein